MLGSAMRNLLRRAIASTTIMLYTCMSLGCGGSGSDGPQTPVSLRFRAVDNGNPVTCDSKLSGFGTDGRTSVGLSDLRFYVSNIHLFDGTGKELESKLTPNEFQRRDGAGDVALIDLTSNISGTCTGSAIAFSEGTERTNDAVQLIAEQGEINRVTFDVGVPQSLMKKVVSSFETMIPFIHFLNRALED